jgi:hypothetical protein
MLHELNMPNIWKRLEVACALREVPSPGVLAEKAGLTRTHIYRIRDGRNVTTSTIEKLAQQAGVNPAWLFYGVGPMLSERRDTEYPNREIAIESAHKVLSSLGGQVVRQVMKLSPTTDPPPAWWFAQLQAAAALPDISEDSSSS